MDVYEAYLTSLAKTEPPITLFEHSSDVLQILDYLISQNSAVVANRDLIRAAALLHDVGKIAAHFSGGKWIHTPHSAQFLDELLEHPRFTELLKMAQVDLSVVDRGLLLKICERHHHQSPELLRSCKDAVLVAIADALASAIEAGVVGQIAEILGHSPYLEISLELVRSLGFKNGFDSEVHHIDLPGQFVEDLLLADMTFRVLLPQMKEFGLTPLLQKSASLWFVGALNLAETMLADFVINPKQLYDNAFEERIYDSILAQLPASGSLQIDSLKYILVNEAIASRLAIELYTRKSVRKVLEKQNLSHLADASAVLFADGVAAGIEALWTPVRTRLLEVLRDLILPRTITERVAQVADGSLERFQVGIYAQPTDKPKERSERLSDAAKNNRRVLEAVDKELAADAGELLKLFDASGNYYRSLSNVLLEMAKMQAAIRDGDYGVRIAEVALLDGRPLVDTVRIENSSLCPVCRRFEQETEAQGLITGNPKTDSVYQTFRGSRGQIRICAWCFLAGYVDLPLATITKEGQSLSKSRDYLLLKSPLSKDKLQWLVDFVRRGRREDQQISDKDEQNESDIAAEELKEIEAMLGVEVGFDELAVLGASRGRLSNLKGFVLPSVNLLENFVGIRIPAERLVGEDKVSGAVQRELVKATMHDFREATGAVSMHYATRGEGPFSVAGRPVHIEEMRLANIAYKIANRYARVGRYRQLHSGLFILLLTSPREAMTRILRNLKRENRGSYAPGERQVKEVIELTEELATQDWKFALGQKIVGALIDVGLTPKDRGFRPDRSGHDLVKWLQRFKMVRDEGSARAWGTMLINALKRGDLAYRDFILQKGGKIAPPGEEKVAKLLDLVQEVVSTCAANKYRLSEFSREVADTDYFLLFYYNHKAKEEKDGATKIP
jgi:hypothetical protein